MKRAALFLLAFLVAASAVEAQYASVWHADWKRTIQPSDKAQTLWVRARIKTESPQNPNYKNLRVTFFLARFDPQWRTVTVAGVGPVSINPGLLILKDTNPKVKLIFRSILSTEGDHWLVSVTLPPIPAELVGYGFTFMLLCREASGPPNYATTTGSLNVADNLLVLIVPI